MRRMRGPGFVQISSGNTKRKVLWAPQSGGLCCSDESAVSTAH